MITWRVRAFLNDGPLRRPHRYRLDEIQAQLETASEDNQTNGILIAILAVCCAVAGRVFGVI